ncbi:APC family permease [Magnetospirillum aberrantis]|nr:APC family permease [Magnetospirillum aberrantis]
MNHMSNSMVVEAPLPKVHELRRGALGVGAITFFVVSAAAPLTAVAGGAPIAMLLGNGAGLAGAYALVTLAVLLFSVGYTAMARNISNSGAFYAFTVQGLGGISGGAAAILALLAYNAMQVGIYGMFGAATSAWLQSDLGLTVPWWICSLTAALVISVLGYRNVDLSAKVLGLLVLGEFLVVLILDVAILRQGGDAGINSLPFQPSTIGSGSLSIAMLFCFASFVGFEATSIYSEEAHDPKRTIPRATYLSVVLIGVFYAFTTWCMALGAGIDKLSDTLQGLQDPSTFLFQLSDQYVGSALTTAMSLLFVTSLFAALLAFHNAVARYFFALGRERLLPGFLGKTHDIHQSPHLGSVLQSLLALSMVALFAIAGLDPILSMFSWLTNLGALAVMVLMALTSFSVVQFFRRRPHLEGGSLRTALIPAIAGVLLTAMSGLAVVNFDVLTGASSTLAIILPAMLAVAAVIGAIIAAILKHNAPDFYADLGAHRD